jgi:Na+/melibiose symporter-like transporter
MGFLTNSGNKEGTVWFQWVILVLILIGVIMLVVYFFQTESAIKDVQTTVDEINAKVTAAAVV